MMKKCALFGDGRSIGVIRCLLHELELGYVEANDAISAIKLLNRAVSGISFILMELHDGISLLEEIRSCPKLNHLPVILISTEVTEENVNKAAALGIDGYIVKPFNMATFNHAIDKIIVKINNVHSPVTHAGSMI